MSASIPIFLSSDDNYSPYVATTIASICYNTNEFVKFYVLDGGISPFHKKLIASLKNNFSNFSLEFLNVNVEDCFGGFQTAKGISIATYSRLLVPYLVKDIDKAVYSDVDVIVVGDIAEMYEQDLNGYAIGAVKHAYHETNHFISSNLFRRMDFKISHKYFYAGNLLMDCKQWREKKIPEQSLEIAKLYHTRLVNGDQCVLNKLFDNNNYKQLDHRFCLTTQDCLYFQDHNAVEYRRLMQNVVIRHFETRRKPWLTREYRVDRALDHFQDFWFFAEMTPFYSGLQQQFIAFCNNDHPLPEIINNIKKPNAEMLRTLRSTVVRGKPQRGN